MEERDCSFEMFLNNVEKTGYILYSRKESFLKRKEGKMCPEL